MQGFVLIISVLKAVATIFIICGLGAILVRKKILLEKDLQVLSKAVTWTMFPALAFVNISKNIDLNVIKELWILPFSCLLFALVGMSFGWVFSKIFKIAPQFQNTIITTCGFGNAGFIPMPLIISLAFVLPVFQDNPEGFGLKGVAYIAIFLLTFTPFIWSFAYALILQKKVKELRFKDVTAPPVYGALLGIVIGLIPAIKGSLCVQTGEFYFIFKALEILGWGTIPCSLIILGGKLSNGPIKGSIRLRAIFSVVLGKLILMPIFIFMYIKLLLFVDIIKFDIILILVLMIEAAMPPATNLIVMTTLRGIKEEEDAMASVMFYTYIISIITVTLTILLTVYYFTKEVI